MQLVACIIRMHLLGFGDPTVHILKVMANMAMACLCKRCKRCQIAAGSGAAAPAPPSQVVLGGPSQAFEASEPPWPAFQSDLSVFWQVLEVVSNHGE